MKHQGDITGLYTVVDDGLLPVTCTPEDRTLLLGSCFSDEMASRMRSSGFDILANPFGTLYNPLSVLGALRLLAGETLFSAEHCVEMGAGAGGICSFYHHTRFARPSVEEFLSNANESLSTAREFYKGCTVLVITFGTARVWEHKERRIVVANCLKRDGREFENRMMTVGECVEAMRAVVQLAAGRKVIFTVSPIRHLGYGAFDNTISKATLALSVRDTLRQTQGACYFPAYEIVNDELRDYRFYAGDMLHPSSLCADIIWKRFLKVATPPSFYPAVELAVARFKAEAHLTGGKGMGK